MKGIVNSVYLGKVVPFTRPDSFTGIFKKEVNHLVSVGYEGIEGDEIGDLKVHGGPEKAVHVYPLEHYKKWKAEFPDCPFFENAGAFGENFSTIGLDESQVFVGDIFSIGTAVVEVSQGRLPCWKLNDRFDIPYFSEMLQINYRTGWYFRVIQQGNVGLGDEITLINRTNDKWSLQEIMKVIFTKSLDEETLISMLELPLVASWRKLFMKRLLTGAVEDWSPRLHGKKD